MAWTFSLEEPVSDKDEVRIHVGDVRVDDGPAPDHSNLSDELIDYFLTAGGSVAEAVALAFDHLAALWISRPIFGPGELSTVHVDMYRKFSTAAADWRLKAASGGGELDGGVSLAIMTLTREDGYTDSLTEYSRGGLYD